MQTQETIFQWLLVCLGENWDGRHQRLITPFALANAPACSLQITEREKRRDFLAWEWRGWHTMVRLASFDVADDTDGCQRVDADEAEEQD